MIIDTSVSHITTLVSIWGYAILLPLAVLEGPIIALIAGVLVSLKVLNFYITFGILLLGDMIGDVLYYALGRWIHNPIAKRFSPHPNKQKQTHLRKMLTEHPTKMLVINKLHMLGSVILYYSGVIRMPFFQFLLINTIASIPKILLLELLGVVLGTGYYRLQEKFGYIALASLLIPILFIFVYWYTTRSQNNTQ